MKLFSAKEISLASSHISHDFQIRWVDTPAVKVKESVKESLLGMEEPTQPVAQRQFTFTTL